MVDDAQSTRSRTQALADRAAAGLFYLASGSALLTLIVWTAIGNTSEAVLRTVTVLVIACPHALGLAIPLVISISTAMSARAGILVKDRLALERMRHVDAVLFDKTPNANWALGWHQDRTICVRQRIDVPGFGPWTIKGGMLHVEPPFALLARMITLRIHLDDVPATNAPLLIAPGSHRLGRIEIGQIASVVERSGTAACLAGAGDIWAYSTPIVHASDRAAEPMRRRVLQVDYSPDPLPGGLVWQGI